MKNFHAKPSIVLAWTGCFVLMLGTLSVLVYTGAFEASGSNYNVLGKVSPSRQNRQEKG